MLVLLSELRHCGNATDLRIKLYELRRRFVGLSAIRIGALERIVSPKMFCGSRQMNCLLHAVGGNSSMSTGACAHGSGGSRVCHTQANLGRLEKCMCNGLIRAKSAMALYTDVSSR